MGREGGREGGEKESTLAAPSAHWDKQKNLKQSKFRCARNSVYSHL